MTFGKRLRSLRDENELSQERIAEYVGVSRQAVSKWENDLSYPDTKNLVTLAEIFNISMDELLNLSPNNGGYVQNETISSNTKKEYYYDEIKAKIITFILLIAVVAINMYIYDTGVYGQVDLSAKFLLTQFIKDSIKYDIVFIVIMVGSLIIFLKRFIKDKTNYIKVTRRATIINLVILQVFVIIQIIIYFLAPIYITLCLLVSVPGLSYAVISELTMQFLKKEITPKNKDLLFG